MNLTERLGFKAELNLETGEINFPDLKPELVEGRRLSDLQAVLAEPSEMGDDSLVHRIYRKIGDTEQIVNSGLKFDITVVMPHPLGRELPKTKGHHHKPLLYAKGVPSPDFYQVVYGKGLILVQRENNGVTEAYEVNAQEMQHVLIPPWMGHLTINLGDIPLVFADICMRADHIDYEPYLSRRGAAYYVFRDGKEPIFAQNPNYQNASFGELHPDKIPLIEKHDGKPLYPFLREYHRALRFMKNPHYFMDFFTQCLR